MKCRMLLLTISSRNNGACVAGIDLETGKWIRLVSNDDAIKGSIPWYKMRYRDGSNCKTLDVIDVHILRQKPSKYQPENVLIDMSKWITKVGYVSIDELIDCEYINKHRFLFVNQWNALEESEIGSVRQSLLIAIVDNLHLKKQSGRHMKADFDYKGVHYKYMSVTDPEWYKKESEQFINRALIVMSLPNEPYDDGRYYKFVARIFMLE